MLRWPLLYLVHQCAWWKSDAVLVLRTPHRNTGEVAGKEECGGCVVHIIQQPHLNAVEIYGFRLLPAARKRGEILWAEDWEPLNLDFCKDLDNSGQARCEGVNRTNSAQREGVIRSGFRVAAHSLEEVLREVLRVFKVDIFFPSVNLNGHALPVFNYGPFAVMEFPSRTPGESRLLNSAMTLLATMGKSILLFSNPFSFQHPEFQEPLKKFQQVVLQMSHPAPLQYCFRTAGAPDHCQNKSIFPEECMITSWDYWGKGQSGIIHATPDNRIVKSNEDTSLPVMISSCKAEDSVMKDPGDGYIFLYGKAKYSTWVDAALFYESPLPVKVLTKYNSCTNEHCINVTDSLVEFHNILRRARVVVAPRANMDNPALLEAVACGTPVVLEYRQHQMLEKYGSSPYAFVWRNKEELLSQLQAAMQATEEAEDHKLPPWQPEPLRVPVMQRGLAGLLKTTREQCDKAIK